MNTFLGSINGTSNVRPPSRGYKYTYQYEKYYRGQLKNVKTKDDLNKWLYIFLDSLHKGHLDREQFDSVLQSSRSRLKTLNRK